MCRDRPTDRSERQRDQSRRDPWRTLRVVGNTDNLEPAALYVYRAWLPASGEEARDFPIYCQRLSFFPEVPEHEAVAELFLPLK